VPVPFFDANPSGGSDSGATAAMLAPLLFRLPSERFLDCDRYSRYRPKRMLLSKKNSIRKLHDQSTDRRSYRFPLCAPPGEFPVGLKSFSDIPHLARRSQGDDLGVFAAFLLFANLAEGFWRNFRPSVFLNAFSLHCEPSLLCSPRNGWVPG